MGFWQIFGLCALAVYPVIFGLRDGATFSTDARKYHRLGFIERLIYGILAVQPFWGSVDFFVYLFASGVWFWIVFDLVWNWTAHKPLFYVGHTALLDVKFGMKIYAAKIIMVVITVVLLLFKNKL